MVSQITIIAVFALAGVALAESCICPMIFSPVCASNGQTFSNKCMVNCYNMEHNEKLEIVGFDRCSKNYAALLKTKPFLKACACPRIYDPVCASNGQIFSNKCMMKCYNAEHNEHLVAVDAEQCSPQGSAMFAKQESDDCVCTKEYNPVCGSNLHTYSNPCMFECAAKKTNGLTIMYHSRCIILP